MKEHSVIGPIIDKPATFDEAGELVTEATYLEGWHVNMVELLPTLSQFQVFPPHPTRVYAGIKTIFLRFASKEEWLSYQWALEL